MAATSAPGFFGPLVRSLSQVAKSFQSGSSLAAKRATVQERSDDPDRAAGREERPFAAARPPLDVRWLLLAKSVVLVVGPGIRIPRQPSVRIMHWRRELVGQFRIQDQAAL
jgi:hypothetical protein